MMPFEADLVAARVVDWLRRMEQEGGSDRQAMYEAPPVLLWAKDREGTWVHRLVLRSAFVQRRRVFVLEGVGIVSAQDVHQTRPDR